MGCRGERWGSSRCTPKEGEAGNCYESLNYRNATKLADLSPGAIEILHGVQCLGLFTAWAHAKLAGSAELGPTSFHSWNFYKRFICTRS